MRKFILMCLTLVAWTVAGAQTPQPKMEFDHTSHNFGKISNKAQPVSHTYTFTNAGTAPLLILSIDTACKCTSVKFSKQPVPPGGTAEIVVTYDPKRQNGTFFKAIQVFTNEPSGRQVITAQGEVFKQK